MAECHRSSREKEAGAATSWVLTHTIVNTAGGLPYTTRVWPASHPEPSGQRGNPPGQPWVSHELGPGWLCPQKASEAQSEPCNFSPGGRRDLQATDGLRRNLAPYLNVAPRSQISNEQQKIGVKAPLAPK